MSPIASIVIIIFYANLLLPTECTTCTEKTNENIPVLDILNQLYGWDNITLEEKEKNIFDFKKHYNTCKSETINHNTRLIFDSAEIEYVLQVQNDVVVISDWKDYIPITENNIPKTKDTSVIGVLSPAFKTAQEKFVEGKYIVRVQLMRELYRLKIQRRSDIISEIFKADVNKICDYLASKDDDLASDAADSLIQKYGTHVSYEVTLGQTLTIEYERPRDKISDTENETSKCYICDKFNLSKPDFADCDCDGVKNYTEEIISLKVYANGMENSSIKTYTEWERAIENKLTIIQHDKIEPIYSLMLRARSVRIPRPLEGALYRCVKDAFERYQKSNMHYGCTDDDFGANVDDQTCNKTIDHDYEFGGVYQTCENLSDGNDGCVNYDKTNPATTVTNCPPDFTPVLFLNRTISNYLNKSNQQCIRNYSSGEFFENWPIECQNVTEVKVNIAVYWCRGKDNTRTAAASQTFSATEVTNFTETVDTTKTTSPSITTPTANEFTVSFGGIFSNFVNNPFTKDKSCPPEHENITIIGDITICIGNYTVKSNYTFGGFFTCTHTNNITNNYNCSTGYSKQVVPITKECFLHYCTVVDKKKTRFPNVSRNTGTLDYDKRGNNSRVVIVDKDGRKFLQFKTIQSGGGLWEPVYDYDFKNEKLWWLYDKFSQRDDKNGKDDNGGNTGTQILPIWNTLFSFVVFTLIFFTH